jgi:hypothetical protein
MVARSLQAPSLDAPATTSTDSARAQRKILDAAQGAREVTLSEREVNALLVRNLGGLPIASPRARLLEGDRVELVGSVPLRRLLTEDPLAMLGEVLPARALARPVWLGIRARVTVDPRPRRSLELDVEEFRVGRQRLPVALLRMAADPALLAALRWPLPATIEGVRIEDGRLIIRSGGPR